MAARAEGTTARAELTATCAENREAELDHTEIKARAAHKCGALARMCGHVREGTIVHPYHSE
ncbi:hypothetical protein CsSME_00019969 [Camellia sinensis var. sinensis]